MSEASNFIVYVFFYPVLHKFAGIPCYVGQGRPDRVTSHQKFSSNLYLRNLFGKYGSLPFVILREGITKTEALAVEVALISALGRLDLKSGLLVNLTDGGDGLQNPSQETIQRLRDSHKGQVPSEANRLAVKVANTGKPRPQHVIDALRVANKGQKPTANCIAATIAACTTPEFSALRREIQLRKWQDPVYRAIMVEARKNRRPNRTRA